MIARERKISLSKDEPPYCRLVLKPYANKHQSLTQQVVSVYVCVNNDKRKKGVLTWQQEQNMMEGYGQV